VIPSLTGAYRLFMYSFATSSQPSTATGDTLVGGGGDDTLAGSSGNDQFSFLPGSAGNATVLGGSGADSADLTAAPMENVTFFGNVAVHRPTTFMTMTTNHSAPNPSMYGQPVTFTAAVTTDGYGTPTGTVDFYDATSKTDLGTEYLQ